MKIPRSDIIVTCKLPFLINRLASPYYSLFPILLLEKVLLDERGDRFRPFAFTEQTKKSSKHLITKIFWKGLFGAFTEKDFSFRSFFFDDLNGILPPLLCLLALLENCFCRFVLLSSRLFCSNLLSYWSKLNRILALSWINTKLSKRTRYYWFKCHQTMIYFSGTNTTLSYFARHNFIQEIQLFPLASQSIYSHFYLNLFQKPLL